MEKFTIFLVVIWITNKLCKIYGDIMKLNNKGFAITTALYGTMVLFLMLSAASLGMLATYKTRMEKLMDEEKGAKCIISGECVGPGSSSSTPRTQYLKSMCTATANRYYCSGSSAVLDGNICFNNPDPNISYGVCSASTDYHWISYKNMCYKSFCNPATNNTCGGTCTIGVCACGTWGTAEWSDTDCGSLNANTCKVTQTRQV